VVLASVNVRWVASGVTPVTRKVSMLSMSAEDKSWASWPARKGITFSKPIPAPSVSLPNWKACAFSRACLDSWRRTSRASPGTSVKEAGSHEALREIDAPLAIRLIYSFLE